MEVIPKIPQEQIKEELMNNNNRNAKRSRWRGFVIRVPLSRTDCKSARAER